MQYDDIVLCATEWKTCHTVYCGGTTMEQFAEYLKTMLIPALSKTDIIVMDNMRSHHAKIVKQVLDESEINGFGL